MLENFRANVLKFVKGLGQIVSMNDFDWLWKAYWKVYGNPTIVHQARHRIYNYGLPLAAL